MNVTDIITRVKRQFGDESGVQVTNDDIIRWINDAQREVVLQNENLFQKTIYLDSVAEQLAYTLPSDLLTIQSVAYRDNEDSGDSYYELRFLSPKALAEYVNGWDGTDYASGTPNHFAKGDSESQLLVLPRPDKSLTDSIKVTYSRYTTDIETDADPIDLPVYYHNLAYEYCLMKAYEMDEDWEAADKKAAYVQSTLDANAYRDSWFAHQTYPSVVPTSEDYL